MNELPPLGTRGWIACVLVAVLAGGLRFGYLSACCNGGYGTPALAVQGDGPIPEYGPDVSLRDRKSPTQFDALVGNLRSHRWFGSLAPLGSAEEKTAHVAPGYYYLASFFPFESDLRKAQAALGAATAVLLFLFARMAFRSLFAATIVGLLAALHPAWIVALGELRDGVVATFLLSAALFLGTQAARSGGPFASVLFGLSLAGLALVRAAFLPFAFFAMIWFLLRCRGMSMGWFAGLLALLGFGNGLAPWTLRNQRAFSEPTPVTSSACLHLWIGTMPGATGGDVDERTLRASLGSERVAELEAEPNQTKRYNQLAREVLKTVGDDPGRALAGRVGATQAFLFGDDWRTTSSLVRVRTERADDDPPCPDWVVRTAKPATLAWLLGTFLFGVFGWRWSQQHSAESRLAGLATVLLPLPYVLTHAEALSGPRLPWDALLVLFAGYGMAWFFPNFRPDEPDAFDRRLQQGIEPRSPRKR